MIKQTLRVSDKESRQRRRELAALYESAQDISATLELSTVLTQLATHTRELLAASYSKVYLVEPETQTLCAWVTIGEYVNAARSTRLLMGEGIAGGVAQSGIGEIIDDTLCDPRAIRAPNTYEESESIVCAPLIYDNDVIGVMILGRLAGALPFVEEDLEFLMHLAPQAAVAIKHAQLYKMEQQHAKALSQTLTQQRELDRMKDQFIQNLSHEFRTPLTIARGYAELLECDGLGMLNDEQQEAIDIIARRLRMLAKLVGDINIILNIENKVDEREPVNFAAMVNDIAADFRITAKKKNLVLNVDVEGECSPIWGDAIHLRRILDNLLSNALKFTAKNGTICIHLYQVDTILTLQVSDTGLGIPEDQLDRVFERFYQVESGISRRCGGVGLGLAMVKEIVEAHNGSICLESEVGKGSTFTIKLPVINEPLNL